MQIAGEFCAICRDKVLFASDATWCARCSSVFHRKCLAKAHGICPSCKQTYDAPEGHFAYSRFCSECFYPNDPPAANCARCGAIARWDNPAEYHKFVEHMQNTSRRYLRRGLVELGLAAACLGTFILILFLSWHGPIFVLPGIFLFAMFGLVADGAARLRHSRIMKRFE